MQIRIGIFAALIFVSGVTAAEAQGGIFGAILNGIVIGAAKKAWADTDPAVKDCLVSRFNLAPAALAQQGIDPKDSRIVDRVNNCANQVAAGRAEAEREAEIERQRQQDAAAAEEQRQRDVAAAEEQRQRDEAAAQVERQKQAAARAREEKAAAAEKKAEEAKRYAVLVQKYGPKTADAIQNHAVTVGMTEDQVLESRGEPISKQVVPPSDQLWKYSTGQIVLTKGHVSYVSSQ